jgi:hypothetical protein
VFISYSSKDKELVDRIVARLGKEGHDVWLDRLRISPGDNVHRKIQDGLEKADAFVVVLSENSFRSELVQQEVTTIALQRAVSSRPRQVIPVRIDEVQVPNYFSDLEYLDLSTDFEAGLIRLSEQLKAPNIPSTEESTTQTSGRRAESREHQIRLLGESLRAGHLTLVCGAGVSVASGIPAWSDLLVRLLDRVMERLSKDHSLDIGRDAAVEFHRLYGGSSSLILGKYLKNNLGDDFENETRDALYSSRTGSSELVESIVDLARPQRNARPLDSIITFNFDCLIEEGLEQASISKRSIFSEAVKHDPNELPIYHVHGYLPRQGDIPETELVFSEDAYHSQFIDAFSWSNLIQLNKLTQNTCLFIGISLTDPNMRRLLDVAWRKSPGKMSHYIIKKEPSGGDDSTLRKVAKLLEEQDANTLGLNVIWVTDFSEIPDILRRVATTVTH